MKRSIFSFLFTIFSCVSIAQIQTPDTVNFNPVTELQTVQTPANTIIAALMGNLTYPYLIIYRSINNGALWDSVFYYGSDAQFFGTPDPVIAADSSGNIYVAVMRTQPPLGGFTAEMWVFKSIDDGQTWFLASTPYGGNDFADYPSITSLGSGLVYHSYTHYTPDTSYITFMRSFDGAVTWQDSTNFATLPPLTSGYDAIGSDLGWSFNNKLCLSYGDYNHGVIYFSSSRDSGASWSPVQNISIASTATYIVTKVVSSKLFSHLGIIAHKPHYLTDVYYLYSLDTGSTWQYQTISTNSAYCEGEIDNAGIVHLVYNESLTGSSLLRYRYSTNQGQTFTAPMTLLTWSAPSLTQGEYQSLIMGSDGLFHLTYVDWNSNGAARHLIFAPMLTAIYLTNPSSHAPRIFPNPAKDYFSIRSDGTNENAAFEIINLAGERLMNGRVIIPETIVNFASFAAGIYLVRISSGNITYVQKLVKE